METERINRGARDDSYAIQAIQVLTKAVFGKEQKDTFESNIELRNAITQIAAYYKKKAKVLYKEESIEFQLDYSMNPLGIMRRKVALEGDWYKDALLPVLAMREDTKEYVALLPYHNRYVYIDQETGKRVYISRRNAALFGKEGILFYQPFPYEQMTAKKLFRYTCSLISGRDFLMMLLLMSVIAGIGLWMPFLSNILMNSVVSSGQINVLVGLVFFMIMIVISKTLLQLLKDIYKNRIIQTVTLQTGASAMMKIYELPVSFFSDYSSGELAQRVNSISEACRYFLQILLDALISTLFSLIYLYQVFVFAPVLVLPALTVVIVSFACEYTSVAIRMERMKKALSIDARERGMVYSIISSIQKIKVSEAENRIFARWANLMASGTVLKYRPVLAQSVSLGTSAIGFVVMYLLAVKVGMSAANYYAFHIAYANVTAAILSLSEIGVSASKAKALLELAKPILEAKTEHTGERVVLSSLEGNVELNQVSFSYPQNDGKIIDRLSCSIKAGEYVAIVGKTGCGKSTLIRLLLGFEAAQNGTISYDGHDISSIDGKSLRSKIGTVLQSGKLFQGTLYSNIAVGNPSLSDEDIWRAAELANIADDIRRMPMGMLTLLGAGGSGLSGGQKQRILIARAIVTNPKIIIFDEATSALDNLSQKKISDSLEQLHCTRIVVAHRLSTVKNCDRILVLDGGHITEEGTFEELMNRKGVFAELVEKQL